MKMSYTLYTDSTDYIYTTDGENEKLIGIPKTGKRKGYKHNYSLERMSNSRKKQNDKIVCRVLRYGIPSLNVMGE
jgi:hypothetical protein